MDKQQIRPREIRGVCQWEPHSGVFLRIAVTVVVNVGISPTPTFRPNPIAFRQIGDKSPLGAVDGPGSARRVLEIRQYDVFVLLLREDAYAECRGENRDQF